MVSNNCTYCSENSLGCKTKKIINNKFIKLTPHMKHTIRIHKERNPIMCFILINQYWAQLFWGDIWQKKNKKEATMIVLLSDLNFNTKLRSSTVGIYISRDGPREFSIRQTTRLFHDRDHRKLLQPLIFVGHRHRSQANQHRSSNSRGMFFFHMRNFNHSIIAV